MSEPSDPIPAATLVLMRERAGGPPELLVTERTGAMAFAAGALVFPGGRIDEDDRRIQEHFIDAAQPDPRDFDAILAGAPGRPLLAEVVRGTIGADLLDYLARDAYFTGFRRTWDERVLRYSAGAWNITGATTALMPSSWVPLAAQSRDDPVPYSSPAKMTVPRPSEMYFIAAS